MKAELNKLLEFNKAFGIYYNEVPSIPWTKEEDLRISLMTEELREVIEEIKAKELSFPKLAKELGDLLFVVYGTIITYGLQNYMEDVFSEICRSNISKLTKEGKVLRREDGKVLKSDQYSPADIESILN